MPDAQQAIQAILAAYNFKGADHPGSNKPVICISRDHGAGGETVGHMLARKLGVDYFDSGVLNRITQRLSDDPEAVKAVDQGASEVRHLWLYSLLTGHDMSTTTYKRHLVNVLVSLGRVGGVIMGRGAHLVLANRCALRVRITGSVDVCAKRVAAAEKIGIEEARKQVEQINHARGAFIWDTFHVRMNDPTTYDVILNTDRVNDEKFIVETLLALREKVAASPVSV